MSETDSAMRRTLAHAAGAAALVMGYMAVVHAAVGGANQARMRCEDLGMQIAAASTATPMLGAAQAQAARDFHSWYASVFVMNTTIWFLILVFLMAATAYQELGRTRR